MSLSQRVSFTPQVRNIIMAAIYLAFTGYSIYQMTQTPQLEGKICYLIIIAVILGIALWSEYLRHLYTKAITLLNMDGKPEEAKQQFDQLIKKDFFKGYRKTELIFDTLYYADQMKPMECLNTLEKDHKFFHNSMDNLLVFDYTKFYAYFLLQNRTKTKQQYERVMKLKDIKVKGTKISPLYNWEFIEAIYQFSCKDYKKSLKAFQNVNTKNMNHRELMHYYYQFAQLYLVLKDKKHADECLDHVISLGGNAIMKQKAETLRNQ
ncbi:hypothetical protein [[Eubacterium] hominis]|uniref:hypothetical protein n=1 Tax=[Eubacterium] hominis TaxID=2764325 RepID=UPI003A4D69A8